MMRLLKSLGSAAVAALALASFALGPAAAADSAVSPIVASLVPQGLIAPVKGSDGRYHVIYELLLTNTLGSPADLRGVEVLDAGSGKSLLKLAADDIRKGEYLHALDRKTADSTTFAPFSGQTLILNLGFDAKSDIPERVVQRFEVSGTDPFTNKAATFSYRSPTVKIATTAEPPVLSPPLEGEGWLASDGCCGPTGHVSALIGLNGRLQASERFAIDWIKIDKEGHVFNGDKSKLESWAGFGAKVLSVGAGVVTVASDGMEEHAPGAMPEGLAFAQHPGNNVAIALDKGFTAVYAHFRPGSIKVKVGDRVKAGDVLGFLGNTGGSLAPHLHFHIVNGPSGFTSDGYPYVLDSFAVATHADPAVLTKVLAGEATFPARDTLKPEQRKDELPLNFDVVDFPNEP